MLDNKKISCAILGIFILFCMALVFWIFAILNDFSFNPSPFVSFKKAVIQDRIERGKDFLYRMEDPDLHGFYKYYDAPADNLEPQLHTVYSASIIYTFLYIYDYDKDKEILTHLDDWAGFLLFMQETDKNSPRYGAFSYSYDLNTKEKEKRYVVGTSALSIFTLLRLYEITGEQKYLDSAKIAGNWLLSMQRPDGVFKPYTEYKDEGWVFGNDFSLLYNGQCLSSLSKLYLATKEEKYYLAAKKTADLFASEYIKAGRTYVVDEYRAKNPISNTWIAMSLMDFYKTKNQNYYKDIVFELSSQIIANQLPDGRIDGAYSTSGNGWILETMSDVYSFCLNQDENECEKYKNAALSIAEWLTDRTYLEEKDSFLPNPERADGGIFWNDGLKYVRTDSVCHALNGYTKIISSL